ncbi:hypothetical protein Pelo_19712 [Pelomyxa schiedti]|nr:hypothetical protein Pelo_19712 [Pelomyxa schiedti]
MNAVDYVGAVSAKYIPDEPANSVSYLDITRAKWIVPQIPGFCDADAKTRDSWFLQVYNMRSINSLAGSRPYFKSDRASEFENTAGQ